MLNLLHEIVRRSEAGEPLAVCTVVRTRGSTPQKEGAVLVVLADGRTLGTIGGGCVEAEVRTRALRLLAEAGKLSDAGRLFSFRLDHDFGWDDGLLCGGNMDVAVEVVDRPGRAASLRQARDALAARMTANLAVEVSDESGRLVRFERALEPRPALVIAGGGHVGAALATITAQLDFDLTVIDDRADFASPERFPGAECRVGPIDAELAKHPIDEQTYVVIVTRGHRHDGQALAAVVGSAARYVGLIGSKRKVVALFDELRRAGVPPEHLAKVHAPIGLDIGAVTPAEIAVSIAAEIIAVRRGAAGRPAAAMRLTPGQLDHLVPPAGPGT